MSESDSTTTFKRIDPKLVPGLFKKHGVKPVRNFFTHMIRFDGDLPVKYPTAEQTELLPKFCVACALGIEAIDALGSFAAVSGVGDWSRPLGEACGLASAYAHGLSDGWEENYRYHGANEMYRAGYEDGEAAYQACLDAGMPVAQC